MTSPVKVFKEGRCFIDKEAWLYCTTKEAMFTHLKWGQKYEREKGCHTIIYIDIQRVDYWN